jgi:hypothetical protein
MVRIDPTVFFMNALFVVFKVRSRYVLSFVEANHFARIIKKLLGPGGKYSIGCDVVMRWAGKDAEDFFRSSGRFHRNGDYYVYSGEGKRLIVLEDVVRCNSGHEKTSRDGLEEARRCFQEWLKAREEGASLATQTALTATNR